MANLYVNTDVAPGGDGSIGNPYSKLEDLLTPWHLTTLSSPYDLFLIGTTQDTSNLDHTVWEFYNSLTNKVRIFGNNTLGKWNTGAWRNGGFTNHAGIYNQYAAHVEVYDLQFQVKITDGGEHNGIRLSTANNDLSNGQVYFIIDRCIVRIDPTSTNGSLRGYINSVAGPLIGGQADAVADKDSRGELYLANSLFIGRSTATDKGINTDNGNWAKSHARTFNNTVAKCLYAYEDPAICINNLATGAAFGYLGNLAGASDYNLCDDGNGIPGSGTHNHDWGGTGTSFLFVDATNGDYHLQSGDLGARGRGLTDPSGSNLFPEDIDGEIRSGSWDCGFDQYVAPSVGQPTRRRFAGIPYAATTFGGRQSPAGFGTKIYAEYRAAQTARFIRHCNRYMLKAA